MTEAFYVDRLTAGRALDVRVPDAETQREVDRIIFEELVVGRVSERSATWFRNLIAAEARSGSEGAILGCTELPMLVAGYEPPLPLFDTTALHAQAAVDFLVG
jgi:aspartate racemase